MEDYKEKYEEAKEIMQEFVRRGSITMDFAKVIFPELGESDDDMEKSRILDFLPPANAKGRDPHGWRSSR